LRPQVLQFSYTYLWSVTFPEVVGEHLIELADRLHESCPASVLDGEGRD
jgi:DNA-binding IclR family transcriptional regulator